MIKDMREKSSDRSVTAQPIRCVYGERDYKKRG